MRRIAPRHRTAIAALSVALVLQRNGDDLEPQVVARPLSDDLWRAGTPEAAGLQQR